MTDLRITKKGLGRDTARFRGALNAMLPSHFIGAVGAGFSAWIGKRWGLAGEGRFTPALMSWLKQRRPFELTPWQNQSEARPANYAFFSTLSLVLTLRPMITIFRPEAALAPRPTAPVMYRGSERVMLLTSQTRREIWRSFRLLCEGLHEAGTRRGQASPAPALAGGVNLPTVGKPLASLIKTGTSHGHSAASPATTTMQFGRMMHFFNERLVPASFGKSQNFETSARRFELAMNPGSVSERNGSRRPVTLWQNAANLSRADGLIVRHPGAVPALKLSIITTQAPAGEPVAPQFMPAIYLARFDSKHVSFTAGNVFTALQHTLAARSPAGREAPTLGVPSFGPAALQYAQREAQLARGFSDALRDFRQSLVNDKASAAPPPAPQIDQLTRQVYDQLKRELRIERERRGL